MSKKKEELVEVTVKLPVQITKYLKTFDNEDLAEAIAYIVVDHVRADVDAATSEMVMEAYDLKLIFKKYGVLSGYEEGKGKRELPLSDEEYAFLEKQGKKYGLTVDELVEVAMLCLFHKYDMKLYEEAKKTAKPQVLKHVEETLKLK